MRSADSRNLVRFLSGPEKAGGSRLWPPFKINDLQSPRKAGIPKVFLFLLALEGMLINTPAFEREGADCL
jgi:hypothetical protein